MINKSESRGTTAKNGPRNWRGQVKGECPNRSIALIADTTLRGAVKMSQKGTIFAVFQKLSVLKRQ
jgi:hypothetical protein